MFNQKEQYLIIGLGNPGREYENSRHNIGFQVIDSIGESWKIKISRVQQRALVGKGNVEDAQIILAKPLTFMNLSGNSVRSLAYFYKIPNDRVMIIFDDLDIPFGEIRIRKGGGSSGQKGMRSIIDQLGTKDIPRMRVGVGRPPGGRDPADFILDSFKPDEQKELPFILSECQSAVKTFIQMGIEKAMSNFNHSVLDDES